VIWGFGICGSFPDHGIRLVVGGLGVDGRGEPGLGGREAVGLVAARERALLDV
jgi:hypothetical protein